MQQNSIKGPSEQEYVGVEHMRAALSSAGIGIWDADLCTDKVVLDARSLELFGFGPGQLPGFKELFDHVHRSDFELLQKSLRTAFRRDASGDFELRCRMPAGGSGFRWVECKGKVYFNDRGEAIRMAGIIEEARVESLSSDSDMAEAAINNAAVGLFRVDLSTNAIAYSSAFAAILTGEPTPDLRREDFISHIHPADVAARAEAYAAAERSGELHYEARTIWRDQSVHWIRTVGSYTYTAEGRPKVLMGTVQDITEEKRIQEEAAAARRLADLAIESSGLGVFHTDLTTNHTEYSPAFAAIFTGNGHNGQFTRQDFIDHIHPDDQALRAAMIKKALTTGEISFTPRVVWDDGSVHLVRITGACIFDGGGRPVAFSGTVKDITEHELQEAALKQAEAQFELARRETLAMFRNVANSSPTGLWLSDASGQLSYLNQILSDWTGLPNEAMLGDGWLDAIVPEDREATATQFASAIAAHAHYDAMFRIRRSDGSWTWCRAAGDPYYAEDGSYAGYAGFCMDINDLVTIANEVKAGEMRFRSIVEQAPMAIGLLRGTDMVIEVGNDKIFELWGKDPDITGMRLLDALPEIEGQGFMELLQHVYESGETYVGNGVPAKLVRKGKLEEAYFDFTYAPLRDAHGTVSGVMALAVEVTEQMKAFKAVEQSEARFRSLIEEAPFATALYTGRELRIETANEAMIQVWGKDESVIGRRLADALPELEGQPFLGILNEVYESGVAFHSQEALVELVVNGVLQSFFFNFTYKPLRDEQGQVYAILNMAVDVTEQVLARDAIASSEAKFRSLIEEAPFATCLFTGMDMKIEVANSAMINYMGRGPSVLGKTLTEAVPEMKHQVFTLLLQEVYRTGRPYEGRAEPAILERDGVQELFYFDSTYKPLFNAAGEVDGIIAMAMDVTDQMLARKKLEESELFARSIIDNSPIAKLVFVGPDMVIHTINQIMLKLLGRDAGIIGMKFSEAVPEFVKTLSRLKQVYATGEMYYQPEEKLEMYLEGELVTGYFNYIFKPLRNTAGEIYGIIATATDITGLVLARQKVEEAELALRAAIELAELGTWSYDLRSGDLSYSERLRDWFGFAEGESAQSTGYDPVHPKDRERVAAALAQALDPGTGGSYDAEYTIVDYRTGRERICHAQGKAVFDEAGNAVKLTGTTRDVTEQRQIQLALEQQVKERTEELAIMNGELKAINEELAASNEQLMHSNEELAQYAYVASHDLQEPLRKIRMFSGMLDGQPALSASSRALVAKIVKSSERMSMLINDLLEFSRLLKSEKLARPVDLNEIVAAVVNDFELTIEEKGADVWVGKLPRIQAIGLQMNQLFYNLLGNALKFSTPGRRPVVEILAEQIGGEELLKHIPKPLPFARYYHISISDNGIGFEVKYAEQIFEVFKRLHGRDMYPGSGIGLALCRRIIDNHNGGIYASSTPGEGTIFHLILPDRQQDQELTLPESFRWS